MTENKSSEEDRAKSLPEVHASVEVGRDQSFLRRLFAFTGPAFMVSVGYMDPGNWATDIAGGARFGYRLIWIILLSNLMAILLQVLSARLGIATGLDLAQACREYYSKKTSFVLWILCEIAIAACDLAEVLGSAIGLHLLFKIPILFGVLATAFDVMILLALQSYGIRKLEAVIVSLVATIGVCFSIELFLSQPVWSQVAAGFVPTSLDGDALYIAIGIIGATVMPHNLYLHSALVQSRAVARTPDGIRQAAKFNFIDCVVAMNGAFLVNSAILILAASTFHFAGKTEVATLQEAHSLLDGLLGTSVAPIAFAIALLAAGQSSTITGTLAGQIVMEGFLKIRLRPWLRRLVTRLLAIVPAVVVILWKGDQGVDSLLVLSQVILSLQLSFAIVPLIHFTGDRRLMGDLATPLWAHILAWTSATIIIGLNLKLVTETIQTAWIIPGPAGFAAKFFLFPLTLCLIPFLVWMIVEHRWKIWKERVTEAFVSPELPSEDTVLSRQYSRIAVALEAVKEDMEILAGVVPLVRAARAELVLIHVVESATGRFIGTLVNDEEARADTEYLGRVSNKMKSGGLSCRFRLGAGESEDEIARIAEEEKVDLIVTGSHGHALLGDLFHGSTVTELRHITKIPVLSIRVSGRTPFEI